MDDFVWLGAVIIGAAALFFGISCFIEWQKSKQAQEEFERQAELDRQQAKYNAQRERFHRERPQANHTPRYPSQAPTARATVLAMRKDEAAPRRDSSPSSDGIADALIMKSMLSSRSPMETRYLDGDPEPVRGHGGTFDGGGSSGDWSSSSSSSGSSSCSSSDSSSSSSSDSGIGAGSGD